MVNIVTKHDYHYGAIEYPKEVTSINAHALQDGLTELIRDYHYKDVRVVLLDNRGGESIGLTIIKNTFAQLQRAGICVNTLGVGVVASAAAMTLSLGSLGHRAVLEGTMLIYHFGRVLNHSAVSNQDARRISQNLEQLDGSLLNILIDHITPLCVQSDPVYPPLTQHEDAIPCKQQSATVSAPRYRWPLRCVNDPNLPSIKLKPREFAELGKCKRYMNEVLSKLFEADTAIQPDTAIALGLIDHLSEQLR